MKPLDFTLLTDENIAPDVVKGLRARGCDLRTAWDEQLIGRPDVDVLERATNQGRVVVTHDVSFGRSAIRTGTSFVGIIYLRPGHISARGMGSDRYRAWMNCEHEWQSLPLTDSGEHYCQQCCLLFPTDGALLNQPEKPATQY